MAKAKEMFDSDSDSGSDSEGSDASDSGASSGSDSADANVKGAKDSFTINEKFAARFEHNKRREEKQRLEEKLKREFIIGDGGSDDDSGTSSSESDEGEIPRKMEEQFARALAKIKKRDPSIYQPDAKLFSDDDSDSESGSGDEKKGKKKKPKKQTLRQVVANQLLEGGARAFEDEDAEPKDDGKKSYVEEQADLKRAFKDAAEGSDGDDESSDSDSDSAGGLRVKKKAGDADSDSDSEGMGDEAKKAYGEYFDAEEAEDGASKEEAFLRDFIMNEKWKEDETKLNIIGGGHGSSSEEEVEEAEKFEAKYNFRFEEPDGANIVSHARRIEGTVRREDTSRRDKRRERKERKLAEKERLKAEVRRLKNLKREEIQRKMAQIASVGGLAGAEAVAAANLNKEFDPEEHDRLMAQMYNEEYYEAGPDEDEEELEKPVFGDLDEEVAALVGKGGVDGAGSAAVGNERLAKLRDALTATGSGRVDDGGDDIDDEDDDAEDEEDDFDGSDDGSDEEAGSDGDEEAPNAGNKFSKRAAKRWKKELMAKMEEYYKLDAEDFIDDMPCRFKYKQVAPSMYGLNTKEILAMTDKQLTQIMPLKKLAPYRHDSDMQTDAKVKARAQRMAREFLAEAEKSQKERKKNKGKKKKKAAGADDDDDGSESESEDEDAVAAAAAEERKASYGAKAWGKHNMDNKPGRKRKAAEEAENSNGHHAEEKVAAAADDAPAAGQGKNAKKNAKKRAKKKEAEAAKAAGMI